MAIPPKEQMTGNNTSEAQFKSGMNNIVDYLGDVDAQSLTFGTTAELKLAKPKIGQKAKTLDSGKVWEWKGFTVGWVDTGEGELDRANEFTREKLDERLPLSNSEKLHSWRDANNIPVMFLDAAGKLWIKSLNKDIASSFEKVDLLEYLTDVTVLENSADNLFKYVDINNIPVFSIKKNGDLNIQKIGVLQDILQVNSGTDILKLRDSNGLPVFKISENGEVYFPKIGNLIKYIEKQVQSVSNQYASAVYQSSRDTDFALSFNLENFEKQQVALTAKQVNDLNVFPHPVTKIRIPAITRIQKNKYLCFFEARKADDDFGENSQGVCTLTVDESTFEVVATDIKSLHSAEPKSGTTGFYTFMNACATKLDSGRIICLYVKRYGTGEHYIYKRYSDNDGQTWSEHDDIGSKYLNMSFYNLLCPCSQGLVKRFGSDIGRIVFPVWYSTKSYAVSLFRAGYIYSDDAGETWADGGFAELSAGNEVQCCEDLNGDIIFNIRLEAGGMGGGSTDPNLLVNKFVRLKGGTLSTFEDIEHQKLTDNSVMAGFIQGRNGFDGRSAKFQFVVAKTLRRKDLTVYTSYDSCKTWIPYHIKNTESFAAYSCIESLSIDKNLILWEGTNSDFFSTSVVSLKNLIGA